MGCPDYWGVLRGPDYWGLITDMPQLGAKSTGVLNIPFSKCRDFKGLKLTNYH